MTMGLLIIFTNLKKYSNNQSKTLKLCEDMFLVLICFVE